MRAVIQRVSEASLSIGGQRQAAIGKGLVVLVAVEATDTRADVDWLSGKIVRLRVFPDENGLMNRSVREVDGEILAVSQFTLYGSTRKGNRPSYTRSARPEIAVPIYDSFVLKLAGDLARPIQTGKFGAHMQIALTNDGPVTLVIDTKLRE